MLRIHLAACDGVDNALNNMITCRNNAKTPSLKREVSAQERLKMYNGHRFSHSDATDWNEIHDMGIASAKAIADELALLRLQQVTRTDKTEHQRDKSKNAER